MVSFSVGAWGDRYGLKKTICYGFAVFSIGSLFCWYSLSFELILVGRMLQGLGIAAPCVLSYIWAISMYPVRKHAAITGFLNGIVTLAVSGAPVIGSFIAFVWGWHANFSLLLVGGLSALVLCLLCEKDTPREYKKSESQQLSYAAIWKNQFVWSAIMMQNLLAIVYYTFVGIAPLLYQEAFGMSIMAYGFHQGTICLTFAASSLLSGYVIDRFGRSKCMRISISLIVCFAAFSAFLVSINCSNPVLITFAMNIFALGCGLPVSILYPLTLDAIPAAKGKISGLQSFSRLTVTALSLQITSLLYDGSFSRVGLVLLLVIGMCFYHIYKLYVHQNLSNLMAHVDEGISLNELQKRKEFASAT